VQILLVDDSKLGRHSIADCLTELGLEFALAGNGTDAWGLLQAPNAPTLVLLDWAQLGDDGIELCRRIRTLESNGAYVHTVVVTAKDRTQELLAALEAGAHDYLVKPVDPAELKARILIGQRTLDQEKLLRFSATHDFLTNLMNRTAILASLERELARAQREGKSAGVIIADLDCSKLLNDTMGRRAVDAVLTELARRLTSDLRPYDLAGRSGGEEFLLLLPGCDLDTAARRADEIRLLVSKDPFDTPAGTVSASVSMGVTVTNCDPKATIEAILHSAEAALNRAKESGRNRVVAFSLAAAAGGRS
jgi:two-component system, cell cycle response regulator